MKIRMVMGYLVRRTKSQRLRRLRMLPAARIRSISTGQTVTRQRVQLPNGTITFCLPTNRTISRARSFRTFSSTRHRTRRRWLPVRRIRSILPITTISRGRMQAGLTTSRHTISAGHLVQTMRPIRTSHPLRMEPSQTAAVRKESFILSMRISPTSARLHIRVPVLKTAM